MGIFAKTKIWWRIHLFVSAMLLLSVAAHAQDGPQNKAVQIAKKRSLEFKLIVLTPTICVGVPLKLRLEVTNVGQETRELNRAYFWDTSLIYPTAEESNKEVFYEHFWPRSTSEDIILLAPGKSYVAHTYWPFYGVDDKYGAGNYTLELRQYGGMGKVQFEIKNCGRKELKEQ